MANVNLREPTVEEKKEIVKFNIKQFGQSIFNLTIQKRVADKFPENEHEKANSETLKKQLELMEKKVYFYEEMLKEMEKDNAEKDK